MIRLLLLTAALCGTVVLTDWTAVERNDVKIPWDLEETPLQIKTDSTLGSYDKIILKMYDKDGTSTSRLGVKFSSPIEYDISSCTSDFLDLPVQPPVEVEKIWTITKTETALIIKCNGVEVLNYLFADSSNSKCITRWGVDVVEQIRFKQNDTASDFYRSDWTAVKRDSVKIPWDLEGTSVQIKTDSILRAQGKDDIIWLVLYDKNDGYISSVRVRFTYTMQYQIQFCTAYTELPVQPPVEVDKIWIINKTETALTIKCNNVEVLNYLFTDSSDGDCVTKLVRDVEKIWFSSSLDTASDFYRADKGIIYTVPLLLYVEELLY
uniref:Putative secretory peptide-40 n=1 Tax=Pleurobrachia bachei TaxID=34499 RepID=M4H1W2_PLEBA|nr:putative secretory peptide-40 [Pleurobrachia bachei]|eukprot:sb/3466823/